MRPERSTRSRNDELAHVAAREHAAGEPTLVRRLGVGLERLGLGPDGSDLVPVGKALRRHSPA